MRSAHSRGRSRLTLMDHHVASAGRPLPPITYYRLPETTCSFRIVADEYISNLRAEGVVVEVRDLDFTVSVLSKPEPVTPIAILHTLFFFEAWHRIRFDSVIGALKKRHNVLLGMEVADTDRVSPRFVQWANHPAVNGIMVPSRFAREALWNSGVVTPLSVVPHGIRLTPPSSKFDYLRQYHRPLILSFASHSARRKGWDIVRELIPEFPSCLFVIKSNAGSEAYFRDLPNTLIINEWLCSSDLASLYSNSDVFVSFHRGGAFELHCIEALGYGLPVVTTRYGSVLDYLNDGNAWLADVDLLETVFTDDAADHCGLGATVDIPSAQRKLKEILLNLGQSKERVRSAMNESRQDWNWQRATQKLMAFVRERSQSENS